METIDSRPAAPTLESDLLFLRGGVPSRNAVRSARLGAGIASTGQNVLGEAGVRVCGPYRDGTIRARGRTARKNGGDSPAAERHQRAARHRLCTGQENLFRIDRPRAPLRIGREV